MSLGHVDVDKNLFAAEQEALQTAMADVADARYCGNELLPGYKLLVNHYQRLLRTTRKIFHISDSQGQVLQQHQNEIQNLLDNAEQGFLTFGRDLQVNKQYSAECVLIFGRKIAGMSIVKLLGRGTGVCPEELAVTLHKAFAAEADEAQKILQQIPSVLRIGSKDVRVGCKLISQSHDAAEGTLIMMILTDITERLRAEAQIYYLSYHDKLTSLYNRAYVEMTLPGLESPDTLPLSIIMVDMNCLKLANDVFGHEQGDRILVAMGQVLTRSCRRNDIIARWGGDEFLVLLPQTDASECLKVCERIRRECDKETDIPIPLSAAVGTATKDEGVARLAEMFSVAENRMYNDKLTGGRDVRRSIITNMVGMLHTRCFESPGHRERVQQLAEGFSAFLGLDADSADMRPLGQLAGLHDIGKIAIPKEILGKAGGLTLSEWEVVKSHSDVGYRMAQSIGEPFLAELILGLHERWDGAGYPHGLKGEQIPFLARLFSIVDVYDVITHDRPYHISMDEERALREIQSGGGSQFDPGLAERFIEYRRQKRESQSPA